MLAALGISVGSISSSAAFWNRKKSAEKPPPAPAESPVMVPADTVAVDEPLRPVAASGSVRNAANPTPGRRPHVSIPDSATERIFVQLAQTRTLREEEIRVMVRIVQEKRGELDRMNQRLEQGFGISRDVNYQYDRDSRTVYRLQMKDGVNPDAPENQGVRADELFDRVNHMTLPNQEGETEFIRLVSARKITTSELQVLQLLLREKRIELSRVHAALNERFAISPDKHYEYDADAHTLFEVVKSAGPPAAGGIPNR